MGMIREFKLPKTDETATFEVLDIGHLSQVLTLQDETRRALPNDQKQFVLPQKPSYFETLLNRQNGVMLGVRVQGQLIAQMAIMGPLTLESAIHHKAITRNQVEFHHAEMSDIVVIAKSMAVHPDWRGNELSQHMLEVALELPIVRAADHTLAQISVNNVRSWNTFIRAGFGIVSAAIDPNDEQPRFIMQKPVLGFAFHPIPSVIDLDPLANFDTIARITGREALIGQLDETDPTKLVFLSSANIAAVWSEEMPLVVGYNRR